MKCRKVINRLSDFQDGVLPETSEKEIRRHLSMCADCLAVARSLEAVREGLRRLPPEPAPPELIERIREAVAAEKAALAGASAPESAGGAKHRPAAAGRRFPFEAAAAVLLFASMCWYATGLFPGKTSSRTATPAPPEAAALLQTPEPPPARIEQDSAKAAPETRKPAAPARLKPVQTAQAPSREAAEPPASVHPALSAAQNGERSIAALPEDISEPRIRVYSLADLPAAPVLRAGTRFTRIQPYAPADAAETQDPRRETEMTPESEARDIESRTARLRPPAAYGREISVEVEPEEREETAGHIAMTAQRFGGAVEGVERAVSGETVVVRVLLPERTASAFIDELRRNGKLPPEGMPERSILPAGPTPGTVAYTVRLHAH